MLLALIACGKPSEEWPPPPVTLQEVMPIILTHCAECHGEGKKMNLTDPVVLEVKKHTAAIYVYSRRMPPPDVSAMPDNERALLVKYLNQ